MLVDLHAHYPMHLQPSGRQLAHEHLLQWEKEWLRARIVRWLSRDFNYQAPGGNPGVTLEEMQDGVVGVILSPLYSPFDEIDFSRRYGAKPRPGYFTELLDQLVLVENDIEEHRNLGRRVTIAHSPAELSQALEAKEQVLIHAVEGGFHLGHDEQEIYENVRQLAERGVAYITVAHLFWRGVATNAPALPFMPDWLYSLLFPQPQRVGLSSLGRAAVNAMVDHGVLVDITHMSEQATIDTLDLLDERDRARHVPVIATHMACRLEAFEYNLPDPVIRRVAERMGLLGLIACEHYISGGAKPAPEDFDASFALMCKHIDHIVKVTGSDDCVAFGSDLDGYIKPALKGIERLGDMRRFQERLTQKYEGRTEAFTSGNALRVLRAAWGVPHPRSASQRPTAIPPTPGPPSSPTDGAGGQPEPTWSARGAADAIAFSIGFLAYLYLAGALIDRVRLSSARLPAYLAPDAFNIPRLIGDGLRSTLLAAGVFASLCLVAYLASALRWPQNGPLWHDLVRRRAPSEHDGGTAPLGEAAVRVIAGFNTLAIASLVALAPARGIDALFPEVAWAVALAWFAAFVLIYLAMTHWAPAIWGRRPGGALWVVVALLALFASAPLGVLVLASVFVSTFGRVLARLERPTTIRALVRSPLPWAVLTVVLMVALAYQAMPPESFPTAMLTTSSGQQRGAYLGRTGDGVYLASCTTSQTDATSTGEHVSFVSTSDVRSLEVRSQPYRFDSGKRPSLLTLAFHAIGGEGDTPTWFNADLRARASTCDGAGTEGVSNDPALGQGVVVAPGPPGGRAKDGEQVIQETTPRLIAELARRFEPTVEVTTADRNWPVSLNAVLAERGAEGAKTCLIKQHAPTSICDVTPEELSPIGASSGDYLQLPTKLENDSTPDGQFEAFMRGQELEPGPPNRWLADPALLEPWSTAQIYFYLTESIDTEKLPEKARNPLVPSGLIGLEYWFYYPNNYYPAVVRAKLMEDTPLASEVLTVDRHQGDWEHIDVLLDPHTFAPRWLYLARHSFEGQFIRWSNAILNEGHPVVQAAYGGHPTYEPGCGPQVRTRASAFLSTIHASRLLSDWLVCGSGRLAFPGNTTPLVDLATVLWACWPGHFGEASRLEITAAETEETLRDTFNKIVFVAGPAAPLRQAENDGVCKAGPKASEEALLPRLQNAQGQATAR
jgi:microsomal dipeptidase-like Zn-dependent dipeptidase